MRRAAASGASCVFSAAPKTPEAADVFLELVGNPRGFWAYMADADSDVLDHQKKPLKSAKPPSAVHRVQAHKTKYSWAPERPN
jgi:hypothetical protein